VGHALHQTVSLVCAQCEEKSPGTGNQLRCETPLITGCGSRMVSRMVCDKCGIVVIMIDDTYFLEQ
jgi:hypothetical protein